MATLKIKRGTRAQLNTGAAGNLLSAGEPYLITDEARLAVGTAANAYQAMAKQGEGSGAPAGANGQIQFNASGAFGVTANLVWDNGNARLNVGGGATFNDPSTSSNVSFQFIASDDSNGCNLKIVGNGAATPSKTIRVAGGDFQILNDAYSALILSLDDAGNLSAGSVKATSGGLQLSSISDPAPPATGLTLYSKNIAGRHMPKIVGPSGIDTVLQVGLHGNSVFMAAPANATTAPTAWGGVLTTAATLSHQQTIASANPWLATRRTRFQTSTTAGNASGMRTAYVQWFRGSAAGFGGFFFRAQFGANINLAGGQKFVGLCASTAALAGDPSALLNMIGVGWDAADASAGNWFLMRNDGAGVATKVDLGANASRANTTHGYDLVIFCPPGAATEIFVRIVNLHTGVTVLDTSYATDLPAVNVGMAFKAEVHNGAVAAADNLEVAKVYIETDY